MHGQGICIIGAFIIPSTCIRGRDIVIALLVIPSMCIRGRDIVIALLVHYPEHMYTWEGYSNRSVSSCVCLCVCLSVCLCVST